MAKFFSNNRIYSNISTNNGFIRTFRKYKWYYLLLLPGLIYFLVFKYFPMFGLIIAFKDYQISTGIAGFINSKWVGFEHFEALFTSSLFMRALRNTLILSFLKLTFGFPFPIIIALLLNELRSQKLKRIIQSSIYVPHFISWAVLGGVVYAVLSPEYGVLNTIVVSLGLPKTNLLMSTDHFRSVLVISEIWKETGWGTIIYLAALSSVNPELHEAAKLDGAGRLKRMWHISIPGISHIVFILLLLRVGYILNAGMLQVLAMYNPIVYEVSEIIETYIYKAGIVGQRYSYTTAVGLFNSVVGFLLIISANTLKKKYSATSLW